MNDLLIKVCGIKEPQTAIAAVNAGVDMVGVMCDPASRRVLDMKTAADVATATKQAGGQPVLIAGEKNVTQLSELIENLDVSWVQLMGQLTHKAALNLSENIRRIYVVNIGDEFAQCDAIIQQLPGYDCARDFILFDTHNPGHGEAFDHDEFIPPQQAFFVAGGLHPDNIAAVVKRFQPQGVDVSTGVEKTLGVKDIEKIKLFVKRARS